MLPRRVCRLFCSEIIAATGAEVLLASDKKQLDSSGGSAGAGSAGVDAESMPLSEPGSAADGGDAVADAADLFRYVGCPKFIVDCVGKLAGWLRVVGCDTELLTAKDNDAMLAKARAEDRVVLTRDKKLLSTKRFAEGVACFFLSSSNIAENRTQVTDL